MGATRATRAFMHQRRPESRNGGFIGLKVQNCEAAFRNITVTPR